jgi:hypothetical protein
MKNLKAYYSELKTGLVKLGKFSSKGGGKESCFLSMISWLI